MDGLGEVRIGVGDARDGKQVAYTWFSGKDYHSELRMIGLGGSGTATPRVFYSNEEVRSIAPDDWSPGWQMDRRPDPKERRHGASRPRGLPQRLTAKAEIRRLAR